MRKLSKPVLLTVCLLILAPLVITGLLYPGLPQLIPTHWNINGTVTYGPKSTLWMLAALPGVITALMVIMPKIDPRRKNYEKFKEYYHYFILLLLVFMLGMYGIVLSETLRPGMISVGRVVSVGIGLLFTFLGNIMPKLKNNFFMGLRNPWTLSDPDVWNRAHRLGGKLFFWFGLVIIVSGLILPERVSFVIMMAGVVVVSGVPSLMSFLWYRSSQRDESP